MDKTDVFYVTIKVKLNKKMKEDDIAELLNELDYSIDDADRRVVNTEIMGFSKEYNG
jgi:uncharacterized protein YpuA (DUF1002 family)